MSILSPAEIRKITEYLHLHAEPQPADLAFVFGTMALIPAQIAAKLYFDGLVGRILVTGGINPQTRRREADDHAHYLQAQGIPPEQILVENQSTNTKENAVFAREMLAATCPEILPLQSVIAVVKWYHARRAIMTLKQNLAMPGMRYFAATYPWHGFTPENWWQTETGRKYVLKEWQVIPRYLAQGDLAEIQYNEGAYE